MTDVYIKPGDVDPQDAQRVLDFLNNAQTAKQIASAVEIPHERDVGVITAQYILDRRDELGQFTNLQQVADVRQIGPERFTEIVICLSQQHDVPDNVNLHAARLLVPVRVEALVVTSENAAGPWAEVTFNPEDDQQPDPFDVYSGRPLGVHLHWALPDGLTRGVQDPLPEEEPPTEENLTEQPEVPPDVDVTFAYIPDRWLVVRMSPGPDSEDDYKRRIETWVLESEKAWLAPDHPDDPNVRVTKLSEWLGGRGAGPDKRRITAVGKGDPTFAAYYDNVQGILSFHDDLSDLSGNDNPLAYLVVGWYSHPENDPLFQAKTAAALEDRLAELSWTFYTESGEEPESLAAAMIEEALLPNQILCHGLVTRVNPSPSSLESDELKDARPSPSPDGLKVAVGNTSIEALSALIAQLSEDSDLEPILKAFHYGLLPLLGESNGPAVLDALLHSEDFVSSPGGFVADSVGSSAETSEADDNVEDEPPPSEPGRPSSQINLSFSQDADTFTSDKQQQLLDDLSEFLGLGFDKIRVLSIGEDQDGSTRIRFEMSEVAANALLAGWSMGEPALGQLGMTGGEVFQTNLVRITLLATSFQELTAIKQEQFVAVLAEIAGEDPYLISILEVVPRDYSILFEIPQDAASALSTSFKAGDVRFQALGISSVEILGQQPEESQFLALAPQDQAGALAHDFWIGSGSLSETIKKIATGSDIKHVIMPFYYRATPRYYEPRDPVVLLIGAGRSMKHGEDGFFTDEGKLVCRISGETVDEIAPVVANLGSGELVRASLSAGDISTDDLPSGQIPDDAITLYHEALLIDSSNDWIAAKSLAAKTAYLNALQSGTDVLPHDVSEDNLRIKINVEQTVLWEPAVNPEVAAETLAALSGVGGKWPSPFAMTLWQQPWTPIHLAWEVDWYPSLGPDVDWQLGELEYQLNSDANRGLGADNCITYQGRTLITPSIAASLVDRIDKLLEDEASGETDQTSDTEEQDLGAIRQQLRIMDVLATSLGGFHDLLIGQEETYHRSYSPQDEPKMGETVTSIANANRFPVRAGHMQLKQLRVIDAFGRFLDVGEGMPYSASPLNAPVRAIDVMAEDNNLIRLPPRIVQPSRLMFRLLAADNDNSEASKWRSPVCGWLLPDHLDEALEVYDAEGANLGQVQMALDGVGLEWQSVPGEPGPWGGPPNLANPHLGNLVQGLLAQGLQDSAASESGEDTDQETALSALLRMIDATLWTVDPLGREGGEHLSVLVGRPLAVVRALLRLELDGDAVQPDVDGTMASPQLLEDTAFPVRLGQLTQLDDGLIGYFVDNDYSQFYPVHEAIAQKTRAVGARRGYLGAIQMVPIFHENFHADDSDPNTCIDPVTHPFINQDPAVLIRPGQNIMLTLLIDARCSAVHATSGILPRKRIELLREHIASALDNISVSFRIGPVLTDPNTIRMPLPAEIRGYWSWVHRTGPTTWQEPPVSQATQDAQLGPTPSHITEGWLKVGGAFQEEDETE